MSANPAVLDTFAADVVRDLQRQPKELQARYLYDPLGSSLFDAICRLPWYRITRSEAMLLRRHARDVAGRLASRERDLSLVELGCGNGEKLELLIDAMPPESGTDVHLIDISVEALKATTARVSRFGQINVSAHQGTYEQGLASVRPFVQHHPGTLVVFLGSNIGNFDPPVADALLGAIREPLARGALFLLGADLVKPEKDLLLAYDDPLGVTAAFNRNLLVRINRELGGDFDLDGFGHQAVWNAEDSRVEMHLVSRRRQRVRIPAAHIDITLAEGDTIWTESSYKYDPAELSAQLINSGFEPIDSWTAPRERFSLLLVRAA